MPPYYGGGFYYFLSTRLAGVQSIVTDILTAINFDTLIYPAATSLWNPLINPSRIVTPVGATFARVAATVMFAPAGLGFGSRRITIRKNVAPFDLFPTNNRPAPAATGSISDHISTASGWFPIVGGVDFLELYVQQDSGLNLDVGGGPSCWLFCEFK